MSNEQSFSCPLWFTGSNIRVFLQAAQGQQKPLEGELKPNLMMHLWQALKFRRGRMVFCLSLLYPLPLKGDILSKPPLSPPPPVTNGFHQNCPLNEDLQKKGPFQISKASSIWKIEYSKSNPLTFERKEGEYPMEKPVHSHARAALDYEVGRPRPMCLGLGQFPCRKNCQKNIET